MRYADALLGAGVIILGVAAFLETLRFPEMPGGMPGPALFPRILSVLLVGFGLLLLLRARRPAEDAGLPFSRIAVLKGVGVLLGIVAYIALVERLGFILTAGGILIGMMLMLGVRARTALPVSAGLVLFIVLLFQQLLRVPLPQGIFGFYLRF